MDISDFSSYLNVPLNIYNECNSLHHDTLNVYILIV